MLNHYYHFAYLETSYLKYPYLSHCVPEFYTATSLRQSACLRYQEGRITPSSLYKVVTWGKHRQFPRYFRVSYEKYFILNAVKKYFGVFDLEVNMHII